MAKARGDFTDILIRRQVLSPDQLDEAKSIQQQTGAKLHDALVKLGYATTEQVMSAIAEFHGMQFVDLTEVTIPAAVVELVPESVARENVVMPLSQENGAIKIIMSDPIDFDTVQKLQFVLNKDIEPVLAPREQIVEAINRHYGQSETESVDSMLRVHRHRHRLHRNRSDHRRPAAGDEKRRPGHQAGEPDHSGSRQPARQRHPHRAVRRPRPHPLPDRRRADRARQPAAPPAGADHQPYQDHGLDRHRRETPPPGRPHQDQPRRQGYRPARQHPADQPWPVGASCGSWTATTSRSSSRTSASATTTSRGSSSIIKRPNGIFLVTGPTGSGKTTTLYAALNELNRPDVKIITAEDPVEYYLPGVNQWR